MPQITIPFDINDKVSVAPLGGRIGFVESFQIAPDGRQLFFVRYNGATLADPPGSGYFAGGDLSSAGEFVPVQAGEPADPPPVDQPQPPAPQPPEMS